LLIKIKREDGFMSLKKFNEEYYREHTNTQRCEGRKREIEV
jgi:hypothetical protein